MDKWKMVPVEPTEAMLKSAWSWREQDADDEITDSFASMNDRVYRAMIDAAPAPAFDEAVERVAFERWWLSLACSQGLGLETAVCEAAFQAWLACARLKAGVTGHE